MTRFLKTLGLTFVALCALGAVMATGASAAQFTAFNTNTALHEPGKVVGTDLEEPAFTVSAESIQIRCAENTYESTSETGVDSTPKFVSVYHKCNAVLFGSEVGSAEVKTSGCEYQFNITGGAGDEYAGTTSIVCSEGVTGFTITTSNGCTIVLPAAKNTAMNGVMYTNNTNSKPTDVVRHNNATNVNSTTSGGFFACGISNGEHTAGTLKSTVTYRFFKANGEQIDYTIM